MADQYGLVVQGDDDANKLTAHYEFNGNGDDLNFYNIVHGAGGDDIISVNSYVASRLGVELYGEEGNDHISGGALGDTLDGGAGDDQIQALGGDDIINGGAGDDLIISLAGHAVIDGGEDTDTLRTSGNFNN